MKNTIFLLLCLAQLQCFAADIYSAPSTIYVPWRDQYNTKREKFIKNSKNIAKQEQRNCIFCSLPKKTDEQALILFRGNHNYIILNLNPFSKGHLLIVPNEHHSELINYASEARTEMMDLAIVSIEILKKLYGYEGFNLGFNLGAIAGASVPEHLHMQLVPRTDKTLGLVDVLSNANVVMFDIGKSFKELFTAFKTNAFLTHGEQNVTPKMAALQK